MQKQAEAEYLQGAADAEELIKIAAMQQMQAQQQQGMPQVNDAVLTKLGQAMAAEAMGGEVPGAEGALEEMGSPADVSPEEIEALVAQLSPQEQEELIQYLMNAMQVAEGAGGEGGAPEAGGEMAPEGMPAGAPEGEVGPEQDMEVAASAGLKSDLATALAMLRQRQ